MKLEYRLYQMVQFISCVISTILLCSYREDVQEKYEGKLNKVMSGPEYEIVSRIMKTLVQRKITVPGTFVGYVIISEIYTLCSILHV